MLHKFVLGLKLFFSTRVFKKYLKFKKFFSEKPTKSMSVGRRSIKLIIAQMNGITAKENNYQYV